MGEGPPEVFLRHVSPDGSLTWIVRCFRDADGAFNFAFGFETDDSVWHGHPDPAAFPGRTREQIAVEVTDGLLHDRYIVKSSAQEDGTVLHALLDALEIEVDHLIHNDEKVSLRFRSGRQVTFDELVDKTVLYRPFDA